MRIGARTRTRRRRREEETDESEDEEENEDEREGGSLRTDRKPTGISVSYPTLPPSLNV